MRWQLEQADEFRQEVEQYTDAERVVLADAYQALLRHGPLPQPGSPLSMLLAGAAMLGADLREWLFLLVTA